ncbi:hypothetical protein CC2G_002364 [Coprinopsis cinerea AmutBmut pab1-1]|nr:hypothetical protein CC2G_002364 [Coprinopsis cinerea AmutBmut pab1-1]
MHCYARSSSPSGPTLEPLFKIDDTYFNYIPYNNWSGSIGELLEAEGSPYLDGYDQMAYHARADVLAYTLWYDAGGSIQRGGHSGRDPRPSRGKPLSDQIRTRAVAFPRPALFLQPPAQPRGDNDDDPGRSTASKDLKNIDEDTYGGNSSG